MRVAINALAVQQKLYGGGNYVSNLVRHLARIDTTNLYTVYASSNTTHHFDGLGDNFQLVSRHLPRPLRILWEQTGLPLDLARRKVGLFHGPGFVSPLIRVCPMITTIFDATFFLFPEKHNVLKRHYFKSIIPLCVKRSNVVITLSQSVKCDLVRLLDVPPEKVRVIYLGKDEQFRPISKRERLDRLRAKYGFNRKIILFVGVIEPRKNLTTLVQAFANLKDLHHDHCLVLAGDFGWNYKSVLQSIKEHGVENHVLFPGYIPYEDLPDLYNAAEVFVYPSLYEGFGLPVLEAMACGVPVITSNISAMPEVTGDAAKLFEPLSSEELAGVLLQVLSNPELRKQMREEGLRRSQTFSWGKTARETLQLYQELVQ